RHADTGDPGGDVSAEPSLLAVDPPALELLPTRRGVRAAAADLLSLTKPRLSSLVLVTTAGGWLLARPGLPAWKLVEVVGATALVVGGANALNCWLERDVDARMRRTRTRPLPAGRMRPATALAFGVLCAPLA